MADAPVLEGIHTVDDFDAADDFTKKHTPYIEICGGDEETCVSITVGHEVPHPNEPGHYIAAIDLYAGDSPVARFDLSPVAVQPQVTCYVNVEPGTTLTAIEHCNLHGLWSYSTTV